jgi:anti-anti-sigma regulatory factor
MATSEENNLIGYDPLAWMDSDTDKDEDHLIINDLVGDDADKSAVLDIAEEDALGIDNIEDEVTGDSALIEDEMDIAHLDVTDRTTEAVVDDSISAEIDDSLVDLDVTLTIQNVVKLHEKLKSALTVHDEIEINASDVSSIDTATLQLLVSLKKEAVKLQKKVTIIYPSPRFIESAQLLGLLDVLEIQDA